MKYNLDFLNEIPNLAIIVDIRELKIVSTNDQAKVIFQIENGFLTIIEQLKNAKSDNICISINNVLYNFNVYYNFFNQENWVLVCGKADKYKVRKRKDFNSFDALTKLPNMHYFCELADDIINNQNMLDDFVILYFNIDKFKTFNEEYGFAAGDEFLKNVSIIINREFTHYLTACFSDDHFVVLTNKHNLIGKIEKVHETVHLMQRNIVMEIKAGIYEFEKGVTIPSGCDRAKLACDIIKYNYSEDYRFYDSSLRETMIKEKYVIDNIENAIENEYLKVYYQPLVRVITGDVCEMESLVRWKDREYGIISPGEFIPILEKHHLIHKVDIFMLDKVCRDFLETAKTQKILIPVSVNLSRLDFQLCDIYKIVEETVNRYNIKKELLHLEVTESALNEDTGHLKQVIKKFRDNGFEVWLDDFGSDYSTLNSLQNYEFDVLKVDMKFFSEFQHNTSSKIIITSVVDMAKRLQMRIVAEGIETKEEYNFLKELGCDVAQGFYKYKPQPLEQLIEIVKKVESHEERKYYNKLSKINLLSSTPMEEISDTMELFVTMPIAIIQYEEEKFKYLFSNESYLKCLKSIGINSLEESEEIFNRTDEQIAEKLYELVDKSYISQKAEGIDFIFNGSYCNITLKEIAETNTALAFFVTMVNLSTFENVKKMDQLESSLHFLYSIYNRVDMLDITNNCLNNIYLNSIYYKSNIDQKQLRQGILEYAYMDIFEEDRQKFLDFYDYTTLKERILKTKRGYIVQILKTKRNYIKYELQFYIIIKIGDQNLERYLSCVRDINMDILKECGDNIKTN